MATYKFGKWESWDGYEYFAIHKKTLFGWKEQKCWVLSRFEAHTKEFEEQQRIKMMESVERLINTGHTVI